MPQPIEIVDADITTLEVDAIVNAANTDLSPGGGVCGAIHRAAGPELAAACRNAGRCPTGEARMTPGFALRAKHVIHAVGPIWRGGDHDEDRQLASAYRASLDLAARHGLASIAIPAISTGIYGFPPGRAASIAVAAVKAALAVNRQPQRVVLCCFGPASTRLHREALARDSDHD